jgi:hypothetical protein
MTIAAGVAKKVVMAIQAAKGTQAAADAASAIYKRRVTSTIDMQKETYQSNEIRVDQQIADFRHGVRSVSGTISNELSPGALNLEIPAILRKAWAAGAASDALSDVTAAVTTGASGTFTTVGGTFMTDGLKVGDVGRWTGWTTTGDPNNAHNFLITALTETVMTGIMLDGVAVGAKAAGDTVTFTCVGKKCWVPATGQTNDYFTIEHNYSDLDLSEVFTDCKIGSIALKLPPSGMATYDCAVVGIDMVDYAAGTAPYFTAPAAQGAGGVLAAVNGALYVAGTKVALLTGLDITIDGKETPLDAVVGSNVRPDIIHGRVSATGNMTVYFENATFRDYFVDETEVAIVAAFTASNAAAADFVAISMPRVKVGGASKDDGEKGLIQTIPFQALLNTTGSATTAHLATTISIQDSLAA